MPLTTPKRSDVMNERFIYPPAESVGIPEGRRHDVDWLRVVAVLLLIPFHSAVIFNRYAEWYVTNEAPSLALEAFAYFLSQWRMPLLFFVSGVGTVFALGFRAPQKYIRERAGRLLLPLAFGVLVIVPPQVYLWRRSDPGYELSYWGFYPTFFNGLRPEGNFE
jgi:glucan biosynthesis protein C